MKIIVQIVFSFLILGSIKMIKDNKLKYPVESYIISIIIYTIIIMLLF